MALSPRNIRVPVRVPTGQGGEQVPGREAGEGQNRLMSGTFRESSLCVKLGEDNSSRGKK